MPGIPGQPFAVTVTVAVIGRAVLFTAVNKGVFPEPLAASPIEGSELVHANITPGVGLVKADATTEPPLQTTTSAGNVTAGVGSTVMV